ncbi:helix-turn-helix domain-containing protein [Rhodococcus erythropolis]|nr:helix-turn-helix domain-containing protein [Rhodococcus erythropolis]
MMATVWLDVWDATRYVNRSTKTLHRWRKEGLVKVGRGGGRWYFDKDSLRAARMLCERKQMGSQLQFRNRRGFELAGPGRGHRKPVRDGGQLVLWL